MSCIVSFSFHIPSYTMVDLYLFIVLIVELLIIRYLKKHKHHLHISLIQPAQKHETYTQTDMIIPIDSQLTPDILLISSSTDSSCTSTKITTVEIGINTVEIGLNTVEIGINTVEINTVEIGINTVEINTVEIGINTVEINTVEIGITVEINTVAIGINTVEINTAEKGINTVEIGINTVEIGINTEEIGINTEEIGINTEEIGINTEEITTDPIQPKEVNEKIEELKHEKNEKSKISKEKALPWRRTGETQHRNATTNLPWRANNCFEEGNETIEKVSIPTPDYLLPWRNILESGHKNIPTNFPRVGLTIANKSFEEGNENIEKAPIPIPGKPLLWKTVVEFGHKNVPINFPRGGLTQTDKVFEEMKEKSENAPILTLNEPILWKTVESRTKNVATSFTGSVLTQYKDRVTKLIISVDARPHLISGYCLNRYTQNCKFYTFATKLLPWSLEDECSSSEFEMKNLMFALLLWEDEITFYKKVRIYTDNWAINTQDCVFGLAVTRFLDHLAGCKDVIRINSNIHVNKKRDENPFIKYIKPVDDLTRWNIKEFQKSISESFGDISYMGSHDIFKNGHQNTFRYTEMLNKVKNAVEKWTSPCESCGFSFPRKT